MITKNKDGDTFIVDGEDTRVLGVDTPESMHVDESRNTPEGDIASARAKIILPRGTDAQVEGYSKDVFGRTLGDIKINTRHGVVDYGLIALDQGMSSYVTEYGTHPNPEQHDKFKEYFSENAPYQYADVRDTLSKEDYASLAGNIAAFEQAEKDFEDDTITRDDFEDKMYAAYGDGKKVAQFRYMNMDWQRKFDMNNYDGSDRFAYDWANQSQENKDAYDKAVRTSGVGGITNPEREDSFWQSFVKDSKTVFSSLNDMAVLSRHTDLVNARRFGDENFDISEEELLKNVPQEYHQILLQESIQYGDDAALQRKDNLLVSLENEEEMAEMPLATQIFAAVPALLLSPTTVIPAAGIGAKTVQATRTIDKIMSVGRLRTLRIPLKVAAASAAAGVETGIAGLPRLVADDTFTSQDMLNEMKWGAAFGAALPLVGSAAKRVLGYEEGRNAVLRKIQAETEALVGRPTKIRAERTMVAKVTPEVYNEIDASRLAAAEDAAMEKPPVADGAEPPEAVRVLTEYDVDYLDNLDDGLPVEPKPDAEVKSMKKARGESRSVMSQQSANRVAKVLDTFTPLAYKRGKMSATVDVATATLTKSFTQTVLESPSRVMNFIGSELLELPEGSGGRVVRQPTAALQQHSLRTRYLTQTQPSYHRLIGDYAGEQGRTGMGRFMSQHSGNNQIVQQFGRDVATVLEQRRQGRPVTVTSPSVLKMVDEFDTSMHKMYTDLVEAGVVGFKAERRIQNYFPQLWNDGNMKGAVTKHGARRVQELVARGYLESKHNAIKTQAEAMHIAKAFITNVLKGDVGDGAMPATMDSRARQRLDIDTTVTDGDLSIMDLMETDFSTVTAKYTNRAAGQVSLANKGIRSDLDVEQLRVMAETEGADMQHFDDAMNIIMGRPTRDGMDATVAEMRDAVALSKMGGLGMAQLAEAGNVLARSLGHLWSDPKVFKKIFTLAGESIENKELMQEIQALSGISNEVHLLERQATHLDRSEMDKIGQVRRLTHQIGTAASFGNLKAPASYILAQGSGFNMIRRVERRIAHASFVMDMGKHFKHGTGKMSPERMRDLGLNPNDTVLNGIFRNVVEYDEHGLITKLHLDQWSPKARERFHLAMYRDDAQMVQQTIGGEMPVWINKPMMTVVAQFKQQAILANKKQLVRQMQFADKEAVYGTLLNMSLAALSRTAKFGTLGAAAYAVTGNESELKNPLELDYWDAEKYVSTFGFFPDMGHMAFASYNAYNDGDLSSLAGAGLTMAEGMADQIPLLGWMKDYYDLGTADTFSDRAEAAKGVAILGNMQFADLIYKGLEAQLED